MKIPEKKKSESELSGNIKWVDYQCFQYILPEEKFEHWGFLVYTEITSRVISAALISKIIAN